MTTAARIIQAAGWALVAVLYVAACILLLPMLAVASWYGTRPRGAATGSCAVTVNAAESQ